MSLVKEFYSTTIGKKIVMAVSGLVLVGFVTGHMLGNLKMFAGIDPASGQYKLDHYAEVLRAIGADFLGKETFLWLVRGGLLVSLLLHVTAAMQLSALNMKAKPVKPKRQWFGSANPASRSMKYGGLFLFCFVIFHILHFTTGTVHYHGFQHGAVYANVYKGFQVLPVTVFYVAAMAFLALHLYHGIWSMFQTLGVDTPVWNKGLRLASRILALVIFLGFISVPLASAFNLIAPPVDNANHVVIVEHGGK